MTIEERLAVVEKTNRKLKLSIVLILVLIVLIGSRGAMRGNFDEITARKILVVGQFGNTIIGLGDANTLDLGNGKALGTGGAIGVIGGNGEAAIMMADRTTSGFALMSEKPAQTIILTSKNDKGIPELSIKSPSASAHLAVSDKITGLQIVAGSARVSAGVASNVPMVAVDNGSDYDALTVGQPP